MAKKTPRIIADTMYVGTFVLSPPTTALTASARLAITSTPRRLQRSASTPEGTSSSGTTTAYEAAITATVPGPNPISFMNSFSIGIQNPTLCRKEATNRGRRRTASPRPVAATGSTYAFRCSCVIGGTESRLPRRDELGHPCASQFDFRALICPPTRTGRTEEILDTVQHQAGGTRPHNQFDGAGTVDDEASNGERPSNA